MAQKLIQYRENVDRRRFCQAGLGAVPAVTLAAAKPVSGGWLDGFFRDVKEKKVLQQDAPAHLWQWSREASHYIKLDKNIECRLCPNQCKLEPESRSKCRVRVHKNGKLFTLVYGNPAAVHIDPIEKKPLYHFHPTTGAFSLGFAGCNFQCLNCQNWELSQSKPEELNRHILFPDQAVESAKQNKCLSIAYTYNEPSVVFEYMLETAEKARKAGLKNIWVTNGYLNREPLLSLCRFIDGANVDLKSFSDNTYQKLNFGRLAPVLDSLKLLKEKKVWFEITNLMVPAYTDNLDEVRKMCRWIVRELGPQVPIHFSRFGPKYKLKHLPPTPPSKLIAARAIALEEGMRYPYIGNYRTPQNAGSNTFCHHCGKTVIERNGFFTTKYNLNKGACGNCKTPVAGRWDQTASEESMGITN
jgi:pyruvate formate lyase activating enzyme